MSKSGLAQSGKTLGVSSATNELILPVLPVPAVFPSIGCWRGAIVLCRPFRAVFLYKYRQVLFE
jgi:hypothetical protein